jgi:hypothetical protein
VLLFGRLQWRASEGSLHADAREDLRTVLRDMIGRDAVDEMQALLAVCDWCTRCHGDLARMNGVVGLG